MVCQGVGRCRICARKHKLPIFGSEKNQHDFIEKVHLKLIVLNTVCMDCIRKFEEIVKKKDSNVTLKSFNVHALQSDCADATEIAGIVNTEEATPVMQFYVEIDNESLPKINLSHERLGRDNFAAVPEMMAKRERNRPITGDTSSRDSTTRPEVSEKFPKIRAERKVQCQMCCDVCTKEFIHRGDLKRHRRKHTGEKPYECPECTKTFSQLSNLTRHRLVHTGERPFACAVCGQSYSRKGRLSDHIRRELCKRKLRPITG